MNSAERRRVTLASIFTVVALLGLWIANRSSSAASSDAPTSAAATPPPTTAYDPATPLFVGGDEAPTPPQVVQIAVPPKPGANEVLMKASFHRYQNATVAVCTTLLAPDGATLLVVNIDNGQSVKCANTLGMALPAGSDIVLDTSVFTQIGDLADAPVPVRVSW
ncbi:MAG: hypothetical protein RI900_2851 [Actinomycetota bacterium]|jgi:hypothetical protein